MKCNNFLTRWCLADAWLFRLKQKINACPGRPVGGKCSHYGSSVQPSGKVLPAEMSAGLCDSHFIRF